MRTYITKVKTPFLTIYKSNHITEAQVVCTNPIITCEDSILTWKYFLHTQLFNEIFDDSVTFLKVMMYTANSFKS